MIVINYNIMKVRFICALWYNVAVYSWVLTPGPFLQSVEKKQISLGYNSSLLKLDP